MSTEIIINETPPFIEWSRVLHENRARCQLSDEKIKLRQILLDVACRYELHLIESAKKVGIDLPRVEPTVLPSIEVAPFILSGHQPVVYHCGLLQKIRRLDQLSQNKDAVCINIIIDTDAEDGGSVKYPSTSNGSVILEEASISLSSSNDHQSLLFSQRIADTEGVSEAFVGLIRGLDSVGKASLTSSSVEAARELYTALHGIDVATAHSIVRRVVTKTAVLELAYTWLLREPVIQTLIRTLLKDAKQFAVTYNKTLDSYRAAHKIKNAANPFPNMEVNDQSVELPFWIIDSASGERNRLKLTDGIIPGLPQGLFLAPRGSITTLLLREYFSDLFIHGLGGAKYDQFVDLFAAEILPKSLPTFVVSSATKYLFPQEVSSMQRAERLKASYKEIVAKPTSFLTDVEFTIEEISKLEEFARIRVALLSEMSAATSPQDKSSVAHKLNALNKDLKEILDNGTYAKQLEILNVGQGTISAWTCREYPYFFFS